MRPRVGIHGTKARINGAALSLIRRLFLALCLLLSGAAAHAEGWLLGPSMNRAHALHMMFLLPPSGHSFVFDAEPETFDLDSWSLAAPFPFPRPVDCLRATQLPDGRVVGLGGVDDSGRAVAGAIYDPSSDIWAAIRNMDASKCRYSPVTLGDGRVLVAGGALYGNGLGASVATADIYDPATDTWAPTGSMICARLDYTATLLPNAKVLVVGSGAAGLSPCPLVPELYDPQTDSWQSIGHRIVGIYHRATLLADGNVLVTGGMGNSEHLQGIRCSTSTSGTLATRRVLLYKPRRHRWQCLRPMQTARLEHTATLLADGKVLVAGGWDANCDESGCHPFSLRSAEVYDPATKHWTFVSSLTFDRYEHAAQALPDGRALVTGGFSNSECAIGPNTFCESQSVELFSPQ